jgi:hypothetical protein
MYVVSLFGLPHFTLVEWVWAQFHQAAVMQLASAVMSPPLFTLMTQEDI